MSRRKENKVKVDIVQLGNSPNDHKLQLKARRTKSRQLNASPKEESQNPKKADMMTLMNHQGRESIGPKARTFGIKRR